MPSDIGDRHHLAEPQNEAAEGLGVPLHRGRNDPVFLPDRSALLAMQVVEMQDQEHGTAADRQGPQRLGLGPMKRDLSASTTDAAALARLGLDVEVDGTLAVLGP